MFIFILRFVPYPSYRSFLGLLLARLASMTRLLVVECCVSTFPTEAYQYNGSHFIMQDASTAGEISASGVAGSFKDKTGWESVKENFRWDTRVRLSRVPNSRMCWALHQRFQVPSSQVFNFRRFQVVACQV